MCFNDKFFLDELQSLISLNHINLMELFISGRTKYNTLPQGVLLLR